MKQVIIIVSLIFLIVNILLGFIIEPFKVFNVALSSSVIVVTAIFLLLVGYMRIKDGFKLSLYLISGMLGVLDYIISLFAKQELSNNWCYIILIVSFAAQVVFLTSAHVTSKKIQ